MAMDIAPPQPRADTAHPHHWLIDPPDGPVSVGRCRHCGLEREFSNTCEAASWTSAEEREAEFVPLRLARGRTRSDFRPADEAA